MNKLKYVSIALFLAGLILMGGYIAREKSGQKHEDPVLTIDSELIEVSVRDGEEVLLQGVTAVDAEDGDLTDSIIVESLGRFKEDGRRIVTYAVADADNHVTHAQRELIYSDYTPAEFTFDKPLSFEVGTVNLTSGIHAVDCLDGDVSASVKLLSEEGIDITRAGKYNAEVKVTNSAGAVSTMPVVVEIYNSAKQ